MRRAPEHGRDARGDAGLTRRLVLAATGLALVVAAGLALRPATDLGPAPPFSLSDVRDRAATVSLADRGTRPAVVNFLAAWCEPCRAELPLLAALHRERADQVAVLGIDYRDSRTLAAELLAEAGADFPTGYDPDGRTGAAYGVTGLPVTVFVAADGSIVERHRGPLTAEALEAKVDLLLARS